MTKDNNIMIYATHTCGYCHALMAWLDDNKINYDVKYIDSDSEAQTELTTRMNGNIRVVPVMFVNDIMLEGFDREHFAAVLQEQGFNLTSF